MEFGVDMTCQKCVKLTEGVLKGRKDVSDFQINLEEQRVVVTSTLPSENLKDLLETTGKRAVLLGLGQKSEAAVAMLGGLIGSSRVSGVVGVVRFLQPGGGGGPCVIDGTIDGLTPGDHALAIHESGDISRGCDSVGEHYDPYRSTRHGSPMNGQEARHVGDLGNVRADESGRATFKFTDRLVNVSDVIGRSLVVADGPDDFGQGNSPMSKVNGDCGKLLSCGIIARSAGIFENSKRICACDGVSLWDERDKPLVGPDRSANNNAANKI